MAMKVRVRNFQSIIDATIDIDGLTVVTGTNNAGKSAFFRAIRGAFTNARGYDFVRQGSPHCTVDIELEDGQTLTWKKGKGVNAYTINGKEFPKVGHGVPAEAKVFGVESIKVGNNELWPQIAPQITGVSFLLHESGSAMAEAVADVDRVNQLSRALKDCDSDKRSTRANLKIRRKDRKTHAERFEAFDGLDAAADVVDGLEKRHKKAEKVAKATGNLVKLGSRLTRARTEVGALNGLEDADAKLPPHERVKEARETAVEHATASRLGSRLKGAQRTVEALTGLDGVGASIPSQDRVDYVQKFRKAIGVTISMAMRFEEAKTEFDRAERAQEVFDAVSLDDKGLKVLPKIKKALDNAKRFKTRRAEHQEAVTTLDKQIGAMEGELVKLSERASEVLGTFEECPTCGGGLDHVH